MSYSTWHNYGYGISDFKTINWNKLESLVLEESSLFEKLIDNFKENADNYSDFIEYLKDEETVSEVLEDTYLNSTPLLILQKIIEAKHNIRLAVVDDFDCNCYLILCEGSPWNFNDTERSLTCEELSKILKQYCEAIDGNFDFGHWSVGNGG